MAGQYSQHQSLFDNPFLSSSIEDVNLEYHNGGTASTILQPVYAQQSGGNATGRAQAIVHPITVNGTFFLVHTLIGTGGKLKNLTLDVESKTMSLGLERIENLTRIQFMTVVFQSELLAGPFVVLYDGRKVESPQSYFVDMREGNMIILLSFPPTTESIMITGTRVAPEFSAPLMAMIIAISITFSLLFRNKFKKFANS